VSVDDSVVDFDINLLLLAPCFREDVVNINTFSKTPLRCSPDRYGSPQLLPRISSAWMPL
jgi:hypothetical protein